MAYSSLSPRSIALALALPIGCGPSESDPTGTTSGGSQETGSGTGADPSADESASGGQTGATADATGSGAVTGDETGSPPDACPADADLTVGECPAQGESCSAGDFQCGCFCGCEDAEPGQPGIWQCSYAREHVAEPVEASVTIDCAAGTIASTVSVLLDNVDGQHAATLTLSDQAGYWLTPEGGGTEAVCGGLCGQGQICPELSSVTLQPGESQPLDQSFGPADCAQDDVDLCAFCNGTARFSLSMRVEAEGLTDAVAPSFEAIPITCR